MRNKWGYHMIAELDIVASVELGSFYLSIEELLQLAPGQKFLFEIDPSKRLGVQIAGERIADAHLIRSEDSESGALSLEIISTSNPENRQQTRKSGDKRGETKKE